MLRRTFLAAASTLYAQTSPEKLASEFRRLTGAHGVSHAVLHFQQGSAATTLTAGPATAATVFLLASITKPMTAIAAMQLMERRQINLADPVRKYLPEFAGGDRNLVTIRHLLTHTSGLPDMLPENDELRKRQAPLAEFTALACKTPLLFRPGAECRYQSMGILLAAEIVQRVTTQPLPAYLEENVFKALGMGNTSLGLGKRALGDTAPSQVSGNDSWNWNSRYWRSLGAPWGGAFAPAADIARLLAAFLQPDQQRILSPKAARLMVANQNPGLNKAWGIGWAVNTQPHVGPFGQHNSPQSFGHGGSVGTLCWADPASGRLLVLLTTKPAAESNQPVLYPLSTLASA